MAGHARDSAGSGGSDDPEANDESFWILMFAGVGLASRIGVQEKPSAPHMRLAFIHLQFLLKAPSVRADDGNSYRIG